MARRWNVFVLAAALSAFAGSVSAQTNFSNEGPSLNRKVRNLGMGNTGVAIYGTADSSPFYNPAGLVDVEKGRFQFFTNTVDVSKSAITLMKDVKNLASDIDDASTDADKTRVLNDFIQANTGKFQHFRYTLDIVNYARRNFAAGLLIDERLDLSFRDQSFPHFDIRNLGDAVFYVAGSHSFWDRLLQVGVTVKPTVRFSLDEADQQVTFADVVGKDSNGDSLIKGQFKKIYKERRFGVGVDLGLKSNLAFLGFEETGFYRSMKPEAGFTWQDIGSPSFGTAPDNRQSLSVGAAIHPDIWKLKNTVAFDVRDLNQQKYFLSKLHVGLESQLPWLLSLRGGLSEGYVTGGASLDLWLAKLDAAIYFEEVGVTTRESGNMRWAATLAFNI